MSQRFTIHMHKWSAEVWLQMYRGGDPWVSVKSRVSRHVRDGEYLKGLGPWVPDRDSAVPSDFDVLFKMKSDKVRTVGSFAYYSFTIIINNFRGDLTDILALTQWVSRHVRDGEHLKTCPVILVCFSKWNWIILGQFDPMRIIILQ